MFLLYALAGGLALGLVTGGSLEGLATLRFRWAWLAIAGFATQVVLFAPPVAASVGQLGAPLYVVSTLLVLAAVVRNVQHVPALSLVVAGATANLAAILVNGGAMPADPAALASAGRATSEAYSNSIVTAHPALAPLIDRFVIPAGVPFANVFSVGDVLIAAGVVAAIVMAMRSLRRRRSGEGRTNGA